MMQSIANKRLLAQAQKGFRTDILAAFRATTDTIRGYLARAADRDGMIPTASQSRVKQAIRTEIMRLFVGYNEQPFAEDGVTALAPYPDTLNKWYVYAVADQIRAHAGWMERNLPDDIYDWLSTGNTRPAIQEHMQAVSRMVIREADDDVPPWAVPLRIFQPNPLAELDSNRQWVPMHKWNDPNGYQLSDRIWRAGDSTRRKIDSILTKGLQQGVSATEIANALEAYLLPTRTGVRTLKPYGPAFMPDGASFDAMRLARTEISRAANHAAYIAGYLNPYVTGMDWALSPSHPKTDVCDSLATIGMGGGRIKPPYAMQAAILPPAHPQCLCRSQSYVTDTPETVTTNLRRMMMEGDITPVITPAQPSSLLEQLLGGQLMRLYQQTFLSLLGV